MPIVSIKRDWGTEPCIIRINTTDDLATATAAGYLTSQMDIINGLNNGSFQFSSTDTAEVYASDGVIFCYFPGQDFSTLVPFTEESIIEGPVNNLVQFTSSGIGDSGILKTNLINRTTLNSFDTGAGLFFNGSTATESGGTVTINSQCGSIITSSLTTLTGASYAITVNNTYAQGFSTAIILASLKNGGTNTAGSNIILDTVQISAGQFTLNIYNYNTGPLNGTIMINFFIPR